MNLRLMSLESKLESLDALQVAFKLYSANEHCERFWMERTDLLLKLAGLDTKIGEVASKVTSCIPTAVTNGRIQSEVEESIPEPSKLLSQIVSKVDSYSQKILRAQQLIMENVDKHAVEMREFFHQGITKTTQKMESVEQIGFLFPVLDVRMRELMAKTEARSQEMNFISELIDELRSVALNNRQASQAEHEGIEAAVNNSFLRSSSNAQLPPRWAGELKSVSQNLRDNAQSLSGLEPRIHHATDVSKMLTELLRRRHPDLSSTKRLVESLQLTLTSLQEALVASILDIIGNIDDLGFLADQLDEDDLKNTTTTKSAWHLTSHRLLSLVQQLTSEASKEAKMVISMLESLRKTHGRHGAAVFNISQLDTTRAQG